jgi:hypothetical protein
LSQSELDELVKRAGDAPLGTWIRERALASQSTSSPAESEPLPPPQLIGGSPAPLPQESYTNYQRRLDIWAMEGLSDKAQRSRLEIATAVGVQYCLSR